MLKKKWKKLAVILTFSSLMLGLSACGDSEAASGGGSTSISAGGAAGSPSESTGATDEGEVLAQEQVLNLKYTELKLLDVNDARNSNEFQVLSEVQEGLFRTFTEDGVEVIENAGCTSYEVSADGLTYTFHLREESVWSDGVPVTAQNYVDSWLRLVDPEEAFSYAFLAEGIVGASAYYEGEGSAENVAVNYIDDYTFSATLTAPDPSFIKKVGMVCFYPIRKDLIDAANQAGQDWTNDYTLHVFNGPFYISNRVLENSMTLLKNETYWNADSVVLTQVNLRVVDESATAAQLIESQQLDILTLSDIEYVSLWDPRVQNGSLVHVSQDEPSVNYLVVDQHPEGEGGPSGLMLNEKVRLAMSLAIDRDEYNEMFQEGLSTPAYSLIPYGITVGDTEFRSHASEELLEYEQYFGDTEYLQKLFWEGLEEIGYTGEPSDVILTVFTYSPTVQTTNIMEWYKQQLESKLGVKVQVDIYPDSSTWVTARNEYQYDFYSMGWNGDFNDPMTFLELFVTGNGYAKFMGGFSDAEYDSLIERAGSSQDDAERLELFAQAEKILLDKGGVIPLYFPQSQIYYQSYVKGLSLPMFGAEYEFSRTYILEH